MKKILTISFIALLASAAAFSDASVSSKSKKHYAKAGPKPAVVEASSKPKAADSERANSGFYVGAGLGWFDSANEFKADPSTDTVSGAYAKGKAKGDTAIVPNVLVGYRFNEYFSADVNAQYRKIKYNVSTTEEGIDLNYSQKIKNQSVFFNGYVFVPTNTLFTPYMTAGIGYARNDAGNLELRSSKAPAINTDSKGKKNNNFAWNAGIGARAEVSKNIDLDLSYRYVSLGKIRVDSAKDVRGTSVAASSKDLKVHQAMLSVIYSF